MIFGTRKVESLGYRMVKKIAEKFNRLSRVHQRHGQQTDNRQTELRRQVALVNASSRSLKIGLFLAELFKQYKIDVFEDMAESSCLIDRSNTEFEDCLTR